MKKVLSVLVTIVSLGIFIFAGYQLITIGTDYYQSTNENEKIQEKFYNTVSAEEKEEADEEEPEDSVRQGLQELSKENDDLVGWIKIDDTKIDYPIVQSDNNIDYLTQNFNKEYSVLGSIFMDYRNDIEEFSKNTVIYGHRTKNGTMFEHLSKFQDKDFFENHQTIEFETLDGSYEAVVFAAYNTMIDFNYIQTDFSNGEEYDQFLSKIKDKSMYQTDIEVNTDDHILTLSTCDYELDENNARLVVHAKLVKKE